MFRTRMSTIILAMLILLACVFSRLESVEARKSDGQAAKSPTQNEERPLLHGSTSDAAPEPKKEAEDTGYELPNPEGTIRVNNLANIEALLNIIANTSEINGICMAGSLFWVGLYLVIFPKNKRKLGAIILLFVPLVFLAGLAVPGLFNWVVMSARDANLIS